MAAKTELAKAYVQIIPSADGIKGKITEALGGEASTAGEKAGLNIVGKIKGIITAAGIGKALSVAINAGANLQQSFGGLDTIYGEAAVAAKKYAAEAATAGISANEYAEQAVSFGASLKQAFGGDMVAAADAANTAIMDMADNAAKMGTDIGSIQNAYQGFAKGQYQLLDNLKLGYGGTKTEMERLLADAEKLSGVEYNIDNLGDVYEAIHVIQDELGVAGVAADEAKTTFSGSMGAMKAAAQNLLANLSLGDDIGSSLSVLGDTVFTFLTKNLMPMVGNVLSGLPDVLSETMSMAVRGMNIAANSAGEIITMGQQLVSDLVVGVVTQIPYIAESAWKLITAFGSALFETDWVGMANNMIAELQTNMSIAAGEIFGKDTSIVDAVIDTITTNLPVVLDQGVNIVLNIAEGILKNLPTVISTAGEIINKLVNTWIANFPQILDSGVRLILEFIQGILSDGSLVEIGSSAMKVIAEFLGSVGTQLPSILQQGVEILGELIAGLINAIPDLLSAVKEIISNAKEEFLKYDWKGIGKDILKGLAEGIKNAGSSVLDAIGGVAESALTWAKKKFNIASPSKVMRDQVGQWIPKGIAVGISDNTNVVEQAMNDLTAKSTGKIQTEIMTNIGSANMSKSNVKQNFGGITQNVYITSPKELSPSETARQMRFANQKMVLAMKGVG